VDVLRGSPRPAAQRPRALGRAMAGGRLPRPASDLPRTTTPTLAASRGFALACERSPSRAATRRATFSNPLLDELFGAVFE